MFINDECWRNLQPSVPADLDPPSKGHPLFADFDLPRGFHNRIILGLNTVSKTFESPLISSN